LPDSYRILLHPSAAEDKIKDRLLEIQNSLVDFTVRKSPEICIAEFETGKKTGKKELKGAIESFFSDYNLIACEISGFGYSGRNNFFTVSFPVTFTKDRVGGESAFQIHLTEKSEGFLSADISGAENLKVTKSPCIPVAEGLNKKEFLKIWKHTGGKVNLINEILLRSLWKNGRRPEYKIRNFCFGFDVLRIAVEKNGKKYLEYDLTSKSWIKYPGPSGWSDTLKNYRRIKRYELKSPDSGKSPAKWLIGDLHIGHYEMISKTARPFDPKNPSEMDKVLTENWNLVVKPKDEVFFLGDLTYNKNPESVEGLLTKLNGKIVFIRGNHDISVKDAENSVKYSYNGYNFLMIHSPGHAPEDYDGWIIHGHTHNSRMCEYPFINFKSRTINVSCEVISYRPVLFDDIISIISHPEKYPEKIMSYDSICEILGE